MRWSRNGWRIKFSLIMIICLLLECFYVPVSHGASRLSNAVSMTDFFGAQGKINVNNGETVCVSISSPEELLLLRDYVENGWGTDNVVFRQTASLSLAGFDWKGIGDRTDKFQGEYDGGGYAVSYLSMNPSSDNHGFFNYLGANGFVHDLVLRDVEITGGENNGIGGVAGVSSGRIRNCQVQGKISGWSEVGGVVGSCYSAGTDTWKIKDCVFAGAESEVTGAYSVGGIAGECSSSAYEIYCITGCKNQGYVEAKWYVGGIAGKTWGNICECVNEGKIRELDDLSALGAGGMAGFSSGIISKCTNYGEIKGVGSGGICGMGFKIYNCANYGSVYGSYYAGGILVWPYNLGLHTYNCLNTGEVMAEIENAGGIVANGGRTDSICSNCVNTGVVSGSAVCGSIAGTSGGVLSDCFYTSEEGLAIVGDGSAATMKRNQVVAAGEIKSDYVLETLNAFVNKKNEENLSENKKNNSLKYPALQYWEKDDAHGLRILWGDGFDKYEKVVEPGTEPVETESPPETASPQVTPTITPSASPAPPVKTPSASPAPPVKTLGASLTPTPTAPPITPSVSLTPTPTEAPTAPPQVTVSPQVTAPPQMTASPQVTSTITPSISPALTTASPITPSISPALTTAPPITPSASTEPTSPGTAPTSPVMIPTPIPGGGGFLTGTPAPTGNPMAVVPDRVTGVRVRVSGALKVTIQWKTVMNAEKYEVYRAAKKKGNYKKIGNTVKCEYRDSRAKRGRTYYYKIAAVSGKGIRGAQSKYKKAVVPWLITPKIKLTKTRLSDRSRAIRLRVLRYEGVYLEVWIRQNKGKFKKVFLKNANIKKHRKMITMGYSKTGRRINCRVRCYRRKKGKKQYSGFSAIYSIRL